MSSVQINKKICQICAIRISTYLPYYFQNSAKVLCGLLDTQFPIMHKICLKIKMLVSVYCQCKARNRFTHLSSSNLRMSQIDRAKKVEMGSGIRLCDPVLYGPFTCPTTFRWSQHTTHISRKMSHSDENIYCNCSRLMAKEDDGVC